MANICTATQALGGPVTRSELNRVTRDAYRTMLAYRGLDTDTDGLSDTPERALNAFLEMTTGYEVDPVDLLSRTFDVEHSDEMILVRNIEFTSLCEHHILPFTGTVDVGYVPNGKVVGLSKIPRVVDAYARRLQVQERLTFQIASTIMTTLDALGCAVVIKAKHGCMCTRGVMKPTADMVTSAMLGVFRTKPEARAEFLSLVKT
jgi:GTP cyclohydrolase I